MAVRKPEGADEEALARVVRADGRSLFDVLCNTTDAERAASIRAYLATQPFPHCEGVPGRRDLMVRVEADGSRSVGRFLGQQWHPVARK